MDDKNYHTLVSLFKKGFITKVNTKYTANESSALLLATEAGAARVVGLLLANGADPTITDADDNTALHRAAFLGHMSIAKVLLEHKKGAAQVNARDKFGKTPLGKATFSGHTAMIALLRENGASDSVRDNTGRTVKDSQREKKQRELGITRAPSAKELKLSNRGQNTAGTALADGKASADFVDGGGKKRRKKRPKKRDGGGDSTSPRAQDSGVGSRKMSERNLKPGEKKKKTYDGTGKHPGASSTLLCTLQ